MTAALSLGFVLLPLLGWATGMPWLALAVGIVVVPAAELLLGSRSLGAPISRVGLLRLIMALVIFQVLALPWLAQGWAALDAFLLALSLGYVSGGTGIVLAHELGHRKGALDPWLSRILLALVAWGPYRVEHNRGHHRHAATWDDPATARATESLYRFLPRYLGGVYANGFRLSREAPARFHEAGWLTALSGAAALGCWLLGGPVALMVWAVQAVVAVFLVAAVDYVEHWGLQRRVVQGRAERMGPAHTWDCHHGLAEALLFNLPRHAHHHLSPGLPGHELARNPDAPRMPTGYAGMVLLASLPPLWFHVMGPRLSSLGTSAAQALESGKEK